MGQCADHTALAGNEAAFSVETSDHSVASRLSLGVPRHFLSIILQAFVRVFG